MGCKLIQKVLKICSSLLASMIMVLNKKETPKNITRECGSFDIKSHDS